MRRWHGSPVTFAEDLIFFNTGEAGFIELSDRVTSGSSLMPQKRTRMRSNLSAENVAAFRAH